MNTIADETGPGSMQRRRAMGIMARATLDELVAGLALLDSPAVTDIRPPETGLVMLRGRIGGDGAPFNMGEATVTRAAVRLRASGSIGISYVLGRDRAKARAAAILDALWQAGEAERIEASVLAPVGARLASEDAREAARTAATRVEFFTMVRGED
jgi:alpha-D-ribose 1-methylphosphonate 5-triphosphate synthase subunit PhnG